MRYLKLIIAVSAASSFLLAAASTMAITAAEVDERLKSGERFLLIDVRSNVHYSQGHIPGAINVPMELLRHKRLPDNLPIIIYTDGRGLIADADALATLKASGKNGEVLEGGFSAWQMHSNVTTSPGGVNRERLPGITYDQLLNADRSDMILIDLRSLPQAEDNTADTQPQRASAAEESDPVAEFASGLSLPVQKGLAQTRSRNSGGAEDKPQRASAPSGPAPLLVLVADDEQTANQAARDLKAAGYHRFTILIGGTESIRHEGRRGMGRQGGELPIIRSQP